MVVLPLWPSLNATGTPYTFGHTQKFPVPLSNMFVTPEQVAQKYWLTPSAVQTPFITTAPQFVPVYQPQPVPLFSNCTPQQNHVSNVEQTTQFMVNQQKLEVLKINPYENNTILQQGGNFQPLLSPMEVQHSKVTQHDATVKCLQAEIEKQKHQRKVQEDELHKLRNNLARQQEKINRLKLYCEAKECHIDLQNLKEQNFEMKQAEVAKLRAVIKGRREELNRRWLEVKYNEQKDIDSSTVKLSGYGHFCEELIHHMMKTLGDKDGRDAITLDKGMNESGTTWRHVSRLQQENTFFRLKIARLELENGEVSKLKNIVLGLSLRMAETMIKPEHTSQNSVFTSKADKPN